MAEWKFSERDTALEYLASAIPRLLVRLDLKPFEEIVEATEQIDHSHQFNDCLIVQAQLPHRGSVNVDSVFATVDGGHRQCDYFFGQGIQLPGLGHDRLYLVSIRF